jgi:ribosomal protein S18 acetylase RimI-like enzyme
MDDLDDIKSVMQEASDFKLSRGDDLWGDEPFTDEEVGRMIVSGNMFVYRANGAITASVILLGNDERMWGDEQGSDGTALYVHKLVTSNASRGQGLGNTVLSLAEDLARDTGKTRLRLDCPYDNEDLYSYYVDLGFHEIRRYDRPSSPGRRNPDKEIFRAALLEKEISGSEPTG